MRKYCFYRMTVDSGFAPNPYHGYCTLATCTPNHMRANLEKGDVIVGVEANNLMDMRQILLGENAIKERCIVYYMRIDEILTLDDYFNDDRFSSKKLNKQGSYAEQRGDNVYFKSKNGKWNWSKGHDHDGNRGVIDQDIKGNRVFISKDFYYFGDKQVTFPSAFTGYLPKAQGMKYYRGSLPELDTYVEDQALKINKKKRVGNPIYSHQVKSSSCKSTQKSCK